VIDMQQVVVLNRLATHIHIAIHLVIDWRTSSSTAVLTSSCQVCRIRRFALQSIRMHIALTRHRASTSMYSLTFCVRVMSPERHHWKPTIQAAAVMLRTPPVTCWSLISNARASRVN